MLSNPHVHDKDKINWLSEKNGGEMAQSIDCEARNDDGRESLSD